MTIEGPAGPPIDIAAFKEAIHTWFSVTSSLVTIWAKQSRPRPIYPYATLKIVSGPLASSELWEERITTDLNRPLGEENEMNYCVPCTFNISCQIYVAQDYANSPYEDALYYMNIVQPTLAMESYLAEFRLSNISVVSRGGITDIDGIIKDANVSRAKMDVVFGASMNAIEYAGYINKVQLVSTELGIDTTVEG